jgi:hypothetical protein
MTPAFTAFLVKVAAARKKKKAPGSGVGKAVAVGTAAGAAGGVAGGAMVAHLVGKTVKREIGAAKEQFAGKVRDFGRMGLLQKIKFLIKKR